MSLVEFLIFILGTTGFTIIFVLSHLTEPIRVFLSSRSAYLEKLLNCTMCFGFWVGLVASFGDDIDPLWAATATSLLSWIIHGIIGAANSIEIYFDQLTDNDNEDDNDE